MPEWHKGALKVPDPTGVGTENSHKEGVLCQEQLKAILVLLCPRLRALWNASFRCSIGSHPDILTMGLIQLPLLSKGIGADRGLNVSIWGVGRGGEDHNTYSCEEDQVYRH